MTKIVHIYLIKCGTFYLEIYNQSRKEELLNQRRLVTNEIKGVCEEIAGDLCKKINVENNTKNRMPDQNFIFREFIDEKNEDEVCSFFKEFVSKINAAAKEKYGDKYVVC